MVVYCPHFEMEKYYACACACACACAWSLETFLVHLWSSPKGCQQFLSLSDHQSPHTSHDSVFNTMPFPLSLSLSLFLSLSLPLSLYECLSLPLCLSVCLSVSLHWSPCLYLPLSVSLTPSIPLWFFLSFSLPPSLPFALFDSLTHLPTCTLTYSWTLISNGKKCSYPLLKCTNTKYNY